MRWRAWRGLAGMLMSAALHAVTCLMTMAGNWPEGLRWMARRVKPSRRHPRNLTDYERKTGWK